MQAVCRDFRDNKAGFFAVSAPMIDFDAQDA